MASDPQSLVKFSEQLMKSCTTAKLAKNIQHFNADESHGNRQIILQMCTIQASSVVHVSLGNRRKQSDQQINKNSFPDASANNCSTYPSDC